MADPLSAMPNQPPASDTPFGTDSQGRDLLAVLILGTWLTLKIGLLAGLMGIGMGATGCSFAPRCRYAMEVCRRLRPEAEAPEPGRVLACHLGADAHAAVD